MKDKKNEELRPMQMLVVLLLYGCVVMLSVLASILIVFGSLDAHATATATVKVIGIPASIRAECHQRRLFAESVAQARIGGVSLDMVQADAFLQAMNSGQSIGNSCHVVQSVYYVWGIDGNVAGIGQAVYEQCIKEKM